MRNVALAALAAALLLPGQDTKYPPQGQQFPGPPTKADTAEWLKELRQYREERRIRAGLSGDLYARPELQWAQSSFMQPQSMIEDRYFYDPATRRYTVDRFLADLEKRYGGIDSVLLWPVYPNIGIDNRSQFDLLRDMPGGLPALKEMVADFHRRGVRVLFPTMPWDVGTRPEPRSMAETIAALSAEIGSDGINGDTFGGIPRSYRAASDAIGHPLVLEPEGYPDSDEMLNWNSMSWGYWKYPFVPMIARGKWLEPRHMVNVCDRWNKDKTDNLQYAFFNGVGYETWENIWGIWNGITERDAEAVRRVAKIERRFAEYLVSADWEPHTPTIQYGVFASKWPKGGRALWTVVNRTVYNIGGRQLEVAAQSGMHYFDLWHGVELTSETKGVKAVLAFDMEASGFGAVLAQPEPADASLNSFLAEMQKLNAQPLAAFPKVWHVLPQKIVPIEPAQAAAQAPDGMVRIPGTSEFVFEVHGIEIEGGDDIGVDVQYPWEDSPRRHHSRNDHDRAVLHRQVPGDQPAVRGFRQGGWLPACRRPQFPEGLEGFEIPGGMGLEAGDLGLARRCAGLCEVGGKAAAARMGMAVRRAGIGPAHISLGQPGLRRVRAAARTRPRAARANGRRPVSERREPVRGDGPDGQHLAMDRRVPGRAHARGHPARRRILSPVGIAMVFPIGLPVERARQVPVDRAIQGSGGDAGIPVCEGRGIGIKV